MASRADELLEGSCESAFDNVGAHATRVREGGRLGLPRGRGGRSGAISDPGVSPRPRTPQVTRDCRIFKEST